MHTLALTLLLQATVPQGPLQLQPDDRICLVGNTTAERFQHDGWLETRLHARHPNHQLVIRNLGFSGDEVTTRLRSSGFGTPDEHLTRQRASVVFAFFGFGESFAGTAGLPAFRQALADWLAHVAKQRYDGVAAPRVVLFSPIAHEDLGDPNLPDGRANNDRLRDYTEAMRTVAAEADTRFVDLFAPTLALYEAQAEPMTINGIHLNSAGNHRLAEIIEQALFGTAAGESAADIDALRAAVLDKSWHWFHRYRTTDGYSIFGGRGKLEFVDGQTNADVLLRELEVLDAMTALRDRVIWARARGGDHTVDDSSTPPFLPVVTNIPGELEDGRHAYLGGEEAIEQMTVHEGMSVGLFASEERFPELVNPVQCAVDPAGRLWVAAWPTYPHWQPKAPMNDKLLILPDEDRDGVADRCIVFADGLHNPTGFEFGYGGVFVAQAPDLWFLADTDGDDVADVRTRVLHGLDSADTHHTANSFCLDPGGALYFQEGTFHHTQVETPWTGVERVANGAVFRYEPRTHRFEIYTSYGFANPHGHVWDRWGQDFVTDGTGAQPYFGASFSTYLEFPLKHRGAPRVYEQRTRPCPATEILSSAHFPPELQGNWLVGNVIGFRGILQYRFQDEGSGFTATELDPILYSADPRFRPVDLEVGADGALYVLDWQNPIIGHMQHNLRDPSRDASHGRVYRVTCNDRPLSPVQPIAGARVEDLVRLLASREDRVRYRARIELSARPTDRVIAAVRAWADGSSADATDYEHHHLEALWLHQQHNVVDTARLDRCLSSPDPRARAAAVRVLCAWRAAVPDLLDRLAVLAEDPHPRVRLEAVRTCSFVPSGRAAEIALLAAKHPLDRFLRYALSETVRGLEPHWQAAIAAGDGFCRDNPAGVRYVLDKLDNDALLAMPRTEAVHRALLERDGLPVAVRHQGLEGLAEARGHSPLQELIELLDSAPPGTSSTADLARLLAEWETGELGGALPAIDGLTATATASGVRAAACAAGIRARGSVAAALQNAQRSRIGMEALLRGVELVPEAALRDALYPALRALVHEVPAALADDEQSVQPGVAFSYYEADRFPDVALPTLAAMTPVATGEVDTLTHRVGPGDVDRFAVKLHASLQVPGAGRYTFFSHSDDGSRVYIDGALVVDNDGLHGALEKAGSIELGAGAHDLLVTYFENGGSDTLRVSWQGPGFGKEEIPADALFLPRGADLQQLAVAALGQLRAHPKERFTTFAALIRDGDHRDVAIEAMLRIPAEDWPTPAAQELARALPTLAAETPFAQRDGEAFARTVQLGRALAGALDAAEAAAMLDSLENLDLQVIRMGAVPAVMRWDIEEFTVVAGKPVKIIFENKDAMPHNLLVAKPGSLETIGAKADEMAADPNGFAKHFVPETDLVLWTTKLVNFGQTAVLDFIAPQPGDYPYICTFPGHWRIMNGVMHVVAQ